MSDQVAAKKILSDLSKREDLKNKTCVDCRNPNPQWASLSFAVFICLQCAGAHRGFGVHISFVRSISMDTWQEDQVKRMQLGGNSLFRDFMRLYEPAELGGYKADASPYDTYHCWAAAQYRDKLDAMLAGREWSPSAPTPSFTSDSRSSSPAPSATQGLRKSRASTRSFTPQSDSRSSSSFRSSPSGTPNPPDQKDKTYFATLGKANEHRPDHLPPSQGGRYTGFGNTPTPPANQHPAYGLSSAAAPSFNDLQENPVAALSKGWSLFAAAVAGATKAVSENVIQPGVERVTDPSFQASVKGYVSEAQKKATLVGSTANQWSKNQFGVDVADSVGGVVGTVRDKVTGGPSRAGYGSLSLSSPNDYGESSGLYDADDDDLFSEFNSHDKFAQHSSIATTTTTVTTVKSGPVIKKADDWDDWKDF